MRFLWFLGVHRVDCFTLSNSVWHFAGDHVHQFHHFASKVKKVKKVNWWNCHYFASKVKKWKKWGPNGLHIVIQCVVQSKLAFVYKMDKGLTSTILFYRNLNEALFQVIVSNKNNTMLYKQTVIPWHTVNKLSFRYSNQPKRKEIESEQDLESRLLKAFGYAATLQSWHGWEV